MGMGMVKATREELLARRQPCEWRRDSTVGVRGRARGTICKVDRKAYHCRYQHMSCPAGVERGRKG